MIDHILDGFQNIGLIEHVLFRPEIRIPRPQIESSDCGGRHAVAGAVGYSEILYWGRFAVVVSLGTIEI